jgi:uncharacterized protein
MRWKVLAALAAALVLIVPATAQQQQTAEPQTRSTVLNVNAQGVSAARPDMAAINAGVTTFAPTAQAALAQNAERMTALIQALRRQSVAERDIQTSWVRVSPRYEGRSNSEPRIIGYEATNTVRANIRDINRVGPVVDTVVAAGGNQIHGIAFAHQDIEAQLNIARRDAVRVARERAELYASEFGMRVVRVISATEAGAAAPSFDDEQIVVTGRRIGGGAQGTPIRAGELETRAQMSVSFELR